VAIAGCEAGRRDRARRQERGKKSLVLGDCIIQIVKTEHMSVQCFPGIRNDQLKISCENRELRTPDTVLIHVVTNDLRRNEYLDYVMC
jgi:hypothetical protein